MTQYIDKAALVAEIKRRIDFYNKIADASAELNLHNSLESNELLIRQYESLLRFLDTLEVIDPYEECIQYSSVKDGIQAHAETYSFNIESELFNQLTKEQQGLWRKEIEQACISGGNAGVELARDPRYKENAKVKEVDLEKAIDGLTAGWIEGEEYGELQNINTCRCVTLGEVKEAMRCMFELGIKAAQKGE